ncbi:MAG: cupin domain-containing protein [Candidatus Latescibacteria bacterium]|nr:cupin domain-containing protein [Candidatus Latescibacterota bacterium]
MTHEHLTALCAAYALDALDDDERTFLEDHLQKGCPSCEVEVQTFRQIVDLLGYSVLPMNPPPAVREQLLALLTPHEKSETQVWKNWSIPVVSRGLTTIRSTEGAWEAIDIPGIAVKRLFVDSERQYVTMLVRMAAGTAYPRHRHGGAEECYVLDGDLHVGDRVLLSGDYQRAEADSTHEVQWTEQGCLLFIVSSQEDELLL